MSPRDDDRNPKRPKWSYAVGYGKPPRKSQFKPGQSGNPSGRRQARPNLSTAIKRVLMSKVQMTIGGKVQMIPRYEAIFWKQMECAIKGSSRSAEWLIRFANTSAPELEFDQTIDINKL